MCLLSIFVFFTCKYTRNIYILFFFLKDDAYKGQNISLHVQEKKRWRKCPCRVRDNMFIIYKDTKVKYTCLALKHFEMFPFSGSFRAHSYSTHRLRYFCWN